MLDTMASRYHLLPSEIIAKGDSLDYYILDAALSWHRQTEQKARAEVEGKPAPVSMPVNKLQDMLDKVRKDDHNHK
jgi:hypothetical protein